MPTSNKLLSHVSEKIARTSPLEGGPELAATLQGTTFVASTWGDYATALMDLHDLTPQESLDALGISMAEINDPNLAFESATTFGFYEMGMTEKFQDAIEKDLMIEVRRLQNIVDEIMSGFKVDDEFAAHEDAEAIQNEIERADEQYNKLEVKSDEIKLQHSDAQDARCMKRDALQSGVVCKLDDFITVMLSTNVTNGEFPSELAAHWVGCLADSIEGIEIEYGKTGLTTENIYVGREIFDEMKNHLKYISKISHPLAQEKWQYISPIFHTKRIEELAIVKGTEQ